TALSGLAHEMSEAFSEGDSSAFDEASGKLIDLLRELDVEGVDDLNFSFKDLTEAQLENMTVSELLSGVIADEADAHGEAGEAAGEHGDSRVNLLDDYEHAIEEIERLNRILNDLDDGGLTSDSIGLMMEQYPELLAYMNDEIALREAISEKIDSQTQIALDAVAEQMYGQESLYKNAIETGNARLKGLAEQYNLDLDNFTNLAQAKQEIERQLLTSLGKMWGRYLNTTAKTAGEMANLIDVSDNKLTEKG